MADEKHLIVIRREAEQRRSLRAAGHTCPVCNGDNIVPLGSEHGGAAWWEHDCGAYSGIAKSWNEALSTEWSVIDAETNAAMHPSIGGTKERW